MPLPGLPAPDIPGNPNGLPAAYVNYPAKLLKSVTSPPGKGGDVTALVASPNPIPAPVDQNAAWQELNKQLNVNLKITISALSDFPQKLAITVASSDIPDILSIGNGSFLQNLPGFLEASCADLTPYLSGDAVKEFPNIANIPSSGWRPGTFNGKLYGFPVLEGGLAASVIYTHQNWLDDAGIKAIKNSDDFMSAMKQFTKPGQQWGMSVPTTPTAPVLVAPYMREIFGVANNWQQANGKFTKDLEMAEHKAAVDFARSLVAAGVMFPDFPSQTIDKNASNFYGGKYAMVGNALSFYADAWNRIAGIDPKFQERILPPFGNAGGKGQHFLGPGAGNMVVLKKASSERIKELLGVLNYLVAPFGTEESLLMRYGIKGVDFNFDDKGNPVQTKAGVLDLYGGWRYVATQPDVLYNASSQDFAKVASALEAPVYAVGVADPSVGLYSATNSTKGSTLNMAVATRINDIVLGRAPMSGYDQIVADWRSQGGDQMRGEYEKAFAG